MEMKKIKYLHILWMDDLKFYKNLVEMINKEKIYFTERVSTIWTKTELEYAISFKNVLEIYGIDPPPETGVCPRDGGHCQPHERRSNTV